MAAAGRVLRLVARHGRLVLILGLMTGLLAPGLALALRPWLPHLIVILLFLNAYRVGHAALFRGVALEGGTVALVLVLQLGLPLAIVLCFTIAGFPAAPLALVLVLLTAAPSVTAAPSLAIMMGHDPAPAFRLLIFGTALLPVTILPVFLLSPALGDLAATLVSALKLLAAIWLTTLVAFALRRSLTPGLGQEGTQTLDGIIALMLAIIVVGLMSALGPTLHDTPLVVVKWLAVALGANLGLQLGTYFTLRALGQDEMAVPGAIVAGNRNAALFLIALPAANTEPLLIFLACYQIPMYLTPVLMARVYRRTD